MRDPRNEARWGPDLSEDERAETAVILARIYTIKTTAGISYATIEKQANIPACKLGYYVRGKRLPSRQSLERLRIWLAEFDKAFPDGPPAKRDPVETVRFDRDALLDESYRATYRSRVHDKTFVEATAQEYQFDTQRPASDDAYHDIADELSTDLFDLED